MDKLRIGDRVGVKSKENYEPALNIGHLLRLFSDQELVGEIVQIDNALPGDPYYRVLFPGERHGLWVVRDNLFKRSSYLVFEIIDGKP